MNFGSSQETCVLSIAYIQLNPLIVLVIYRLWPKFLADSIYICLMYLSTNNNFKLDRIVKGFEVAYRSEIVEVLINKFPTLNEFSIAINQLPSKFENNPVILSRKWKGKAEKIAREIGAHYKKIQDCYNDFLVKNYVDTNVPYVSEIIDYVNLLFNDCFTYLFGGFESIEVFLDNSAKFQNVRNALSHPASAKIKVQDSLDVISFIEHIAKNIKDEKFWFLAKKEIEDSIGDLKETINDFSLKVHNLNEISFPHNKIVYRDRELQMLKNDILGEKGSYRKSGSFVIYGYGGVGKTALVIEFLSQIIKDSGDKNIPTPYDFILFFSAKEEVLTITQTTGEVNIDTIKKQISSFNDFKVNLDSILLNVGISDINDSKGLVVVDNFETLQPNDKETFINFIKHTSRSIQFILTSRNEEPCENKLHLQEFKDISNGVEFLNQYIEANNIQFTSFVGPKEKRDIAELSKGNTLIIVLAIQQLATGDAASSIIGMLKSVESSNMEKIADFMYKNTIQSTIKELENEGKNPSIVLKVLSLYGQSIDLYSLSALTDLTIFEVEKICLLFTSRLALEKTGELFQPNEFANRFILHKYLPNYTLRKELLNRIHEMKERIRKQAEKLELDKKKDPSLKSIMDDWKPTQIIDKISIAESHSLMSKVARKLAQPHNSLDRILNDLEQIEKRSTHPYIKMQKARVLTRAYELLHDEAKKKEIAAEIIKVYDDVIMSVKYYYQFIIKTKSFASINWKFGLVYVNMFNDLNSGARYLEDSVAIFRIINKKDKTYYFVLSDLSGIYYKLYLKTNNEEYLQEIHSIYREISTSRRVPGFKDYIYFKKFGPIVNRQRVS